MAKWVYGFGDGRAEGSAEMRDLLGGKGANLAEMSNLGLPVPPGFTITTEVCAYYYAHDRQYPDFLEAEIEEALIAMARITGRTFGDAEKPLLVSVRSGARASMPGMMDTVLNLGLNDQTVDALAAEADRRFAYDSYRRFIQMYSDVVLGIDHGLFEERLEDFKDERGVVGDTELDGDDWAELTHDFKSIVQREKGVPFPQAPRPSSGAPSARSSIPG
jgi:pyruvate,orthophosphate dikinase